MRFRILLRPTLAVVFAFVGALIARGAAPPEIFEIFGDYFLIVAIFAFGILGFITPDLVELAGRTGIAALAFQIARQLPRPPVKSLPFRSKNKKMGNLKNPLVVDTSALIDGRVVEIGRCGFLLGTLLVLPSVVSELHNLADKSDDRLRARGRRGLDSLALLQDQKSPKLSFLSAQPSAGTVDDKLLKIAKKLHGKIITLDYNLAKVAKLKKIDVLNINELANALKTAVLPKDRLRLQITDVGKAHDQGVGYLDDGTMVVVEGGRNLKGRTVWVSVQKVLQTAAGKMVFARPV